MVEIEKYKQTTSGDLETNDYEKALQDVREWFLANPEYKLENNNY